MNILIDSQYSPVDEESRRQGRSRTALLAVFGGILVVGVICIAVSQSGAPVPSGSQNAQVPSAPTQMPAATRTQMFTANTQLQAPPVCGDWAGHGDSTIVTSSPNADGVDTPGSVWCRDRAAAGMCRKTGIRTQKCPLTCQGGCPFSQGGSWSGLNMERFDGKCVKGAGQANYGYGDGYGLDTLLCVESKDCDSYPSDRNHWVGTGAGCPDFVTMPSRWAYQFNTFRFCKSSVPPKYMLAGNRGWGNYDTTCPDA